MPLSELKGFVVFGVVPTLSSVIQATFLQIIVFSSLLLSSPKYLSSSAKEKISSYLSLSNLVRQLIANFYSPICLFYFRVKARYFSLTNVHSALCQCLSRGNSLRLQAKSLCPHQKQPVATATAATHEATTLLPINSKPCCRGSFDIHTVSLSLFIYWKHV